MSVKSFTLRFYLQTISRNHTWRERARAHSSHGPKPISKLTLAKLWLTQIVQPHDPKPISKLTFIPFPEGKKKKKKNQAEREGEAGHHQWVRESRPPLERERGRSPELEIDSTAVWAVPLTADLPCFSLPPSATHVTDLPFFSLPMSSKPPQDERPNMTKSPPPCDLASAASRSNPVASLSLPSSLNLTRFDDFFFVGFCFFCVYLEMILYICLEAEKMWENVFSIVFSRIQPNTRKYFSKHFLKCNQTFENIFISWNYFTLRKYFTLKQTQP